VIACVCRAAAAAFPAKWHSAIRIATGGLVLAPASGAYDVTVSPGSNVQEAVDACPPGGSVLLLPGTREGPLMLAADKEVHVFGRGRALLRVAMGTVLTSEAATSTVDGLIIRREAGNIGDNHRDCVWIKGGQLRMQMCDIVCDSPVPGVAIEGGADPVLHSCRCVHARALSSLCQFLARALSSLCQFLPHREAVLSRGYCLMQHAR